MTLSISEKHLIEIAVFLHCIGIVLTVSTTEKWFVMDACHWPDFRGKDTFYAVKSGD